VEPQVRVFWLLDSLASFSTGSRSAKPSPGPLLNAGSLSSTGVAREIKKIVPLDLEYDWVLWPSAPLNVATTLPAAVRTGNEAREIVAHRITGILNSGTLLRHKLDSSGSSDFLTRQPHPAI
jgi:hypothetical protein